MDDLKRILTGRQDFYAKADMSFDTSGRVLADAYLQLRGRLAVQLSSD
jgi:XRE family aerobic/anaerobic benzoate catabolism transcriptional regulator